MHVPQKQQNPDASGVQVFTASAGSPTQPAILLQFAKQSAFTLILECQLFCVRNGGKSTARRVLYRVLLNISTAVRLGGCGYAKYKLSPASCQPHQPRAAGQSRTLQYSAKFAHFTGITPKFGAFQARPALHIASVRPVVAGNTLLSRSSR